MAGTCSLAGQWRRAIWTALGLLTLIGPLAGPLGAQVDRETATLSGVVVDATSGRPVSDALVAVPARSIDVRTDENGTFELRDVPVGAELVTVRRFGYRDLHRLVSLGSSGTQVELELQPSPFGLEGLIVAIDSMGPVSGRVVEAGSGRPLEGVVVWLPAEERGASADSAGHFQVRDVAYGPQVLQIRRVGYQPELIPISFGPDWTPMDIRLQPDAGVLAALPALSDRLRGRRNMFEGIVTTHDTERITHSGVYDVREYLHKYTLVRPVPCSGSAKSFWCIDVGGRAVEPQVCIDGWHEWGGLDLLQRMGPDELHLLEIYGTSGLLIRAYTHEYIERLAVGADGIRPEEPAPQREGVDGVGWSSGRSGVPSTVGPRC